MNFPCSKAVAASALLLAGCALFAPIAQAGDRIEFSAPAIPLTVPRPDVDIKEPGKILSTADIRSELIGDADMPPMQENVMLVRRKTTEKNPWNTSLQQDNNQDQRDAGGSPAAQSAPNRLPNADPFADPLNMQRGWASRSDNLFQRGNDSRLETGQDSLKPGSRNEFDKDGSQNKNRPEQNFFIDKDASFWTRPFNHDLSAPGRLNALMFVPSMSGIEIGAAAYDERMNNPAHTLDSSRSPAISSGYESLASDNENQSRQTGDQTAGNQEYIRAWEPPPDQPLPSRTYSNPEQIKASRPMAPNSPVRLPMPKRPGDPF